MEILDTKLTMISIWGIKDALRPGVKEAVQQCHKAGINVRMITGDNIVTARAIAIDAGIITEAELVDSEENQKYLCVEPYDLMDAIGGKVDYIEGNAEPVCTIENMEEFRVVAKQLKVMARTTPD